MPQLSLRRLKASAARFVRGMSGQGISELYGTTDGKAVGTYVEHAFQDYLRESGFDYVRGSSASGVDFPELEVDLKVTSLRQPQSSCPFSEASQKVYGLGHHLLVFVYDKRDDAASSEALLDFRYAIFVERRRTADYQTTAGLLRILEQGGNKDDVVAFLEERNLPLDEIGRERLAERILKEPPVLGYLTVSNALQWRLQFGRIVSVVGQGGVYGVESLL